MATEQRTGGNGFLYFAIGALIVAVAVLGWMYYDGAWRENSAEAAIEDSADAIGDAADDISDSVRDATRDADNQPSAPSPS